MATAIHHGGGVGTYKTFSVIQRHAIPQLQAGRTVVSTIRGFDNIRVIEAVLDLEIPDSAKIIFVDLETTEGIEKIRRWWEWVPKGAYIIIDEAQLIYPKSKRINTYDYPERDGMTSAEAAEKDDRPNGFLHAFTMQRHYQWDLAIITPNIKMLVPEIREVTQSAYEHKYLGGIAPWLKHGWREIQHNPLEMGKQSVQPPIRYKADKRIYKVYKSTKTGAHSSGNAEQSMFKNPKIIFLLSFSLFSVVVLFWILQSKILGSGGTLSREKPIDNPVQIPIPSDVDYVNNRPVTEVSDDVVILDTQKPIETTRFHSNVMSIVGKMFDEYIIEVGVPPKSVQFSTSYLYNNGVKLKIVSDCLIEMTFDDKVHNVRCPLHHREFKDESNNKSKVVELKPFGALTDA